MNIAERVSMTKSVIEPWQQLRTKEQNDLLQPACRDLSKGVIWKNGVKLTADEWRWLICADIMGQKPVAGISGGIVLLGGSSRKLNKDQATEAITTAFHIGDCPWEYELSSKRVQWSPVIRLARGIPDSEI